MSQPDDIPNYITCLCQHCGGHIKFDANQLRQDETKRIECPHCHLQTIIFAPQKSDEDSHPVKNKSPKPELVLFEITRIFTLSGVVLVFFALIITGFQIVKTFQPEKPQPILPVYYEVIAPVTETAPNNQNAYVPSGPKMASPGAFPQPVVDFLIKHQAFSLKQWLEQLPPEHTKPFLDNLATIIQTANSKKLTYDQSEKLVKDYADLWIHQNEKLPDPNAAIEKQAYRTSCVSIAFGLFLSLTTLCLILVMLAIERNTRPLGSRKPVTRFST